MDLLQSFMAGEWLTEEQSLSQILRKTIALLEDPARWTTEALARDASGERVSIADPSAVMFSIEGALARASNDVGVVPPAILHVLDQELLDYLGLTTLIDEVDTRQPAVAGILEERDLGWFNDSYSHEEILKFLRDVLSRTP